MLHFTLLRSGPFYGKEIEQTAGCGVSWRNPLAVKLFHDQTIEQDVH
jgi:hypothetical protein